MSYTQLTEVERYQIHTFLKPGYEHNRIVDELNRSPSTISRELKRNRGLRGYRPVQAWRLPMSVSRRIAIPRLKRRPGGASSVCALEGSLAEPSYKVCPAKQSH